MATYTLDATVHESVDIALDGVTLGRYNGDTKEADLTPVYVDGGYNARNYTATDTLPDSTGRRWRWTATDIYGNSGSATVPQDRALVWADIVTCEDARIQWSIEGTTLSSGSITVSTGGYVVKTVTVTQLEGNAILNGGLDPDTTYYITLTASVDGGTLTGSGMFHTDEFVPNYLCFTNNQETSMSIRLDLNAYGEFDKTKLEYSRDQVTWNTVTQNLSFTITEQGSKVYFRGTDGTLSTSDEDYLVFSIYSGYRQARITVSGDVNFLLSRNGGLISTPSYSWYRLFYNGQKFLYSNLSFSGKTIGGPYAFAETFRYAKDSEYPLNLTSPSIGIIESYAQDAGTVFERTFANSDLTDFNPFTGHPKYLSLDFTCQSCNRLTSATVRARQTNGDYALWHTFQDCTALSSCSVHIPTIGNSSFYNTFKGCTALRSITSESDTLDWAGGTTGFTYENNWLVNASSTGTFHKPQSVAFASAALPVGWTIANDVTA